MRYASTTLHGMLGRVIGLAVIGALALASLSVSPASSFSTSYLAQLTGGTRMSDGGQMTISASWAGDSADLTFWIVMDTHAVDLDAYDLAQLAVLRTGDGVEIWPSAWDAPPGGHHREGTLRFPSTGDDGNPVVKPESRSIELVIQDVAGVPERILRWQVDGS